MGDTKTDVKEKSETEIIKEKRGKSPVAFVKELVDMRARNDKTMLPEYPSAQLWYSLNEDEKSEFIKVVKLTGMKWEVYEQEMRNHFPSEKKSVTRTNEVKKI